jgi:hypothetical protein
LFNVQNKSSTDIHILKFCTETTEGDTHHGWRGCWRVMYFAFSLLLHFLPNLCGLLTSPKCLLL